MNLTLMLSCPFSIQGREPYLSDFMKKKNFDIGLYSDISFKHGMMIKTTKLYIFTFTFIRGHSCLRNKKASQLWCPFSCMSINLDEIQYVAT